MSLVNRIALLELYQLTLPERLTASWEDEILISKIVQRVSGEEQTILAYSISVVMLSKSGDGLFR